MGVLWELENLGMPIPIRITKIDLTVKKKLPDLIIVLKNQINEITSPKNLLADEIKKSKSTSSNSINFWLTIIQLNTSPNFNYKIKLPKVKLLLELES